LTPVLRYPRAVAALSWVLWWLSLVEVGLRVLSFSRLTKFLGVPFDTTESVSDEPELALKLRPRELGRLRMIERVVGRWPFCDGPCLRQALVTGRNLRRLRPVLRLGVAGDPSGVVEAHAWLEVCGRTLGGTSGFTPLVSETLAAQGR
jgi:hypothetical protein